MKKYYRIQTTSPFVILFVAVEEEESYLELSCKTLSAVRNAGCSEVVIRRTQVQVVTVKAIRGATSNSMLRSLTIIAELRTQSSSSICKI
jgi:predicted ATP-grasp superfamily ATP-dependent carboligase